MNKNDKNKIIQFMEWLDNESHNIIKSMCESKDIMNLTHEPKYKAGEVAAYRHAKQKISEMFKIWNDGK